MLAQKLRCMCMAQRMKAEAISIYFFAGITTRVVRGFLLAEWHTPQ